MSKHIVENKFDTGYIKSKAPGLRQLLKSKYIRTYKQPSIEEYLSFITDVLTNIKR